MFGFVSSHATPNAYMMCFRQYIPCFGVVFSSSYQKNLHSLLHPSSPSRDLSLYHSWIVLVVVFHSLGTLFSNEVLYILC